MNAPSPWPLLLSGRWLYRCDPQLGWTRQALDGSAPAQALDGFRLRRLRPLLQRWLACRAMPPPLSALALARSAERRHALPDLSQANPKLPAAELPRRLQEIGTDRYGRWLRLEPTTAAAFRRMYRAASTDGIHFDIVSAFRSPGYQAGIWQRKLAVGKRSLQALGKVSAPPGRSEHHSGRALDLASGPGPVLESSFARTDAYRWLRQHAGQFGFVESYPRDNTFGVIAEPWHWCHHPAVGAASKTGRT